MNIPGQLLGSFVAAVFRHPTRDGTQICTATWWRVLTFLWARSFLIALVIAATVLSVPRVEKASIKASHEYMNAVIGLDNDRCLL